MIQARKYPLRQSTVQTVYTYLPPCYSFDWYQETDVRQYGVPGPDPHGYLFTDFEYTFDTK